MMKKKLSLFMVFMLSIFLLTSCSSEKKTKKKNDFLANIEKSADSFAKKKKEEMLKKKREKEEKEKELSEARKKQLLKWQEEMAKREKEASKRRVEYVVNDDDLRFLIRNTMLTKFENLQVNAGVKNGVVKLYGRVKSKAEKQKLIKALKKIPGVKKIDASYLQVGK